MRPTPSEMQSAVARRGGVVPARSEALRVLPQSDNSFPAGQSQSDTEWGDTAAWHSWQGTRVWRVSREVSAVRPLRTIGWSGKVKSDNDEISWVQTFRQPGDTISCPYFSPVCPTAAVWVTSKVDNRSSETRVNVNGKLHPRSPLVTSSQHCHSLLLLLMLD